MTQHDAKPVGLRLAIAGLFGLGTILGLSGTDLVLPALPLLPGALGGSPALAQLVIAAYVAGTAVGLLLFGGIAERFGRRRLFLVASLLFGISSLASTTAQTLEGLVLTRLVQGFSGASAAVFAPAIIKQLFTEKIAVRALGMLGSIESLVPALAPVVGAWLLTFADWRMAFTVTGVGSLLLAGLAAAAYRSIPAQNQAPKGPDDPSLPTYRDLVKDPVFIRYAVSQATTLGGLLVFVFGAPVVFINALGGELGDFVRMQLMGITCFIIVSNMADRFLGLFGAEGTMRFGTLLAALGALSILLYALTGGGDTLVIAFLFIAVNVGLGIRGPVGFLFAMKAAKGSDDRGSSLTMLAIMGVAAGGTALVAPMITLGLVPLAATAFLIQLSGLILFLSIRPFGDPV